MICVKFFVIFRHTCTYCYIQLRLINFIFLFNKYKIYISKKLTAEINNYIF